jgi:hypothetical protein
MEMMMAQHRTSGSMARPTARLHAKDAKDAVIAAARGLLTRITHITTAEFERGGDRDEREALREALAALDQQGDGA